MTVSDEVRIVADILRGHAVDFVVVGGQAVLRTIPRATGDVDVMVTTATYDNTVAQLRGDSRLIFRGNSDGVAQFYVNPLNGMGLDVLDAISFSGSKPGGSFYDFLVAESSTEVDGIRFASLEAVWYTRLLVRSWEAYVEKILADVTANASLSRLGEVRKIAKRFGTEEKLAPRFEYLREEAKHLE